jgi:hypothetical protein
VAINYQDPQDHVRAYIERGKYTFTVALGGPGGETGVFKDYQVHAYPTNFLIDPQGKIVGRWVGYDEPTMGEIKAALRRLGL